MPWTDDEKILNAYDEAKASLEMESIFLPEEIEILLKQRAKKEMSGEEFRKKVLEFVKE